MKQLKLLFLLMFTLSLWKVNAQTGASCATAISINQPSTQTYTSTGTELWYSFSATSSTLTLAVKEHYNQINVSKIELYGGICGSLKLLAKDSLTFPTDSLKKISSTTLNVSKTYYVRVCFINGQNPNTFDLITSTVLIPLCSFCVTNYNTGATFGCYGGCVNPVPTITLCQGQAICLSSDCSDEFPQQFDFSNGDPSVSATSWDCAYYNPSTTGIITVSMPTPALAECSGIICYLNVLGATPPPLFSVDPGNPMCIGTCLTLTSLNDPATITGFQFNLPTASYYYNPAWGLTYCTTFLTPGVNQIEYVLNPGQTCSVVATYDAVVLEPEITLTVAGAACTPDRIFTAAINCNSNLLLPITYNWHIYSGTSNSGTLVYTSLTAPNLLNYSFSTPGTYYVEVTSSSGGIQGQVITIGSGTPPAINITGNLLNLCNAAVSGMVETLNPHVTLGAGDVAIWSASNANTSAPLSIPFTMGANGIINYNLTSFINYPDPINFCVSVTINGCENTQCYTLYPCCPVSPGIVNINNITYTGLATLSAPNYVFSGIITLNPGATLNILAAEVSLSPNTKIIVKNGAKLKINNSWLHACSAMWDGIYLYQNSEIVINGSYIDDAKRAVVDTLGAAKIRFGDVIFNKNHTALILKKNITTTLLALDATVITSSSFVPLHNASGYYTNSSIMAAPVVSAFPSQKMLPPYNTKYGQYGVMLLNTARSGGNKILISGLICDKIYQGIVSVLSKIDVVTSTFQNHTTALHPTGQPLGVFVIGSNLSSLAGNSDVNIGRSVIPAFGSFRCDFINNNYGVYNTGSSKLDVLRNTFTDQKIAVLVTDNKTNKQVTIDRNKLFQCQIGFDLYNNYWLKADITENRLDNTAAAVGAYNSSFGVFTGETVSSAGSPSTYAKYYIFNNYIDGYYNGIYVSNTYKTQVNENEIHMRPDNTAFNFQMGIRFENTNSIVVNTNTVDKPSPDNSAWWQFGVFADHNTIPVIACNSINNIYASIKLQLQNYTTPGTGIIANVMNHATHGIWLDANAEIGDQYLNLFGPTYNCDNQWSNMGTSQTFVSGNSNQTSSSGGGLPSRLYTKNAGGGAYYLDPTLAKRDVLSSFPLTELKGAYGAPSFGGGINCAGNTPTPLLRLMQRANNIAANNLVFATNNANLNLMSKRSLLKNLKAENINLNLPANAALKTFAVSSYSTSVGQLFMVDSLVQAANTTGNTALLSNAQSINNTVANTTTIEQNQKWLNDLYITLQANIPDSGQIAQLEQLAVKCPQNDGEAVYQARSLLMNYTRKSYNSICDRDNGQNHHSGSRMAQVESLATEEKKEISLYPNPTAKDITVEYNKSEGTEDAVLSIYNTVGELVVNQTLSNAKTTININNQAAGIYIYFIKQGDQTLKTNKLVIAK